MTVATAELCAGAFGLHPENRIQPRLNSTRNLTSPSSPRHQISHSRMTARRSHKKGPESGVSNSSGKMSGRGGLSQAVNNSWRQNKPRCLNDRHPASHIAQLRRTKRACLCFTMSCEPQKTRVEVHIHTQPGVPSFHPHLTIPPAAV